jgi:hypothetical protein
MISRQRSPSLLSVIAHARAGALDYAWRIFREAGFDAETDDPRALSVKGRLLKDFALRAEGDERMRFYREASSAYQRAAELGQATYPLINAATLSLLARDGEKARVLATQVLGWIAANPDEPETPYYHGATVAEALLLLGKDDEARAALSNAIAVAPRAWEDHASTLRQFELILKARQAPAEWLDVLRPPRSLHFSGHMSFKAGDPADELSSGIARMIAEEKIGFGFGALAAGADIIIAEALLDAGAELHVVLPGGAEAFAARSVDPYGAIWRARFDAVLERAEAVRPVRPENVLPDETIIDTASTIAMGLAIRHARGLESEAVQCLVIDSDQPHASLGASTIRAGDAWRRAGLRQRTIEAPRQTATPREQAEPTEGVHRAYALLAIGSREWNAPASLAETELTNLHEAVAGMQTALAPHWSGEYLILAFERPADAVAAGLELTRAEWPVGADFSVGVPIFDPFAEKQRLPMQVVAACCGACASSLEGSFQATEDLVVALALEAPDACAAQLTGELESPAGEYPISLFALRPPL